LSTTQWLICIIAAIGFAFDTYELLMAPLVVPAALQQLGGLQPGSKPFLDWVAAFFYLPAVFGGIFGLLGGYLTDWFGRRRVLTWSILLYAISALAAGFATTLPMLLFFRCTTLIGVCVEFVAAVAWLAELFHHPKQKEAVLGWTQAFSSLGGIMVTTAYGLAVTFGESLPAIMGGHEAWRYTLISGVIPAIPLIVIRPFLPESPAWQEKKVAGTLRRPSLGELFQPALRRTTLVATLMMACAYAAAFGAIQQIPRIVPGVPEVVKQTGAALQGELPELLALPKPALAAVRPQLAAAARKPKPEQAAAVRAIPQLADLPADQVDAIIAKLPKAAGAVRRTREGLVSSVQGQQELGGLIGRIILAILALFIVSRRSLLRVFQIPGLIVVPLVFFFASQDNPAQNNLEFFKWGALLAGLFTVAQFSFWGNYLPRAYPVHLRGTGESFAANIGGRLIGTSAALLTTRIETIMPGSRPEHQTAAAAAAVALGVYLIGFIASFWLPEPKKEMDEKA
jgi:MFS family permease